MHDVTKHGDFIQGLRDLAQFIEDHPELSLPLAATFTNYGYDSKAEASMLAAAMRPCKKDYQDTLFSLIKEFGPHSLRFVFMRNEVCEPVVIGKRIIPAVEAKMVPAKLIEAQPEREEEIVEWRCGTSLLESGSRQLKQGTTIEMEVEPLALAGAVDDMPF